jgi:hypothetical protein
MIDTHVRVERDDSNRVVFQANSEEPAPLFSRGNAAQGHAHNVRGKLLPLRVLVQLPGLKKRREKSRIKILCFQVKKRDLKM